jgi:hypothetical protein
VILAVHVTEIREPGRSRTASPWRENIDHISAADGALRGLITQDQTIAVDNAQRPIEHKLNQP